MYKKDFIKRNIDAFLEALTIRITGVEIEDKETVLSDMAKKYFGKELCFFTETSADLLINEYSCEDLELIVALLENSSNQNTQKCIDLLEYINKNHTVYSFEREMKLSKLKNYI
ncbi:hypothetical protein AB4865_01815 [Capnocytophaga sp. ARDL2]|uniref:hypothetical protein n=1 Tax=Capnocytophaga sp. ARDL2 TaxID=3238809 RepID=UPI003557B282